MFYSLMTLFIISKNSAYFYRIFHAGEQCHFGHRLKNNKLDLWMIRNNNIGKFFFQLTQKFERNIFYDMATSKILASF